MTGYADRAIYKLREIANWPNIEEDQLGNASSILILTQDMVKDMESDMINFINSLNDIFRLQ